MAPGIGLFVLISIIFKLSYCYSGPELAVRQSINDVLYQAEMATEEELKREARMATGTAEMFEKIDENSPFKRMHRFKRTPLSLMRDDRPARVLENTARIMLKRFENRYDKKDILAALAKIQPLGRTSRQTKCSFQNINCNIWQNIMYRRFDGKCNNLKNTLWGSAGIAYRRLKPAEYADGISKMRESVTGGPLPSAREVVIKVTTNNNVVSKAKTSMLMMSFGQFANHDIGHTQGGQPFVNGNFFPCGDFDCKAVGACEPIMIPEDDPFYKGLKKCLSFLRSKPTESLMCNTGARQHINDVTSALDGSTVYGSDEISNAELRDPKNKAKLKVRKDPKNPNMKPMLPPVDEQFCSAQESECGSFKAGDVRVSEQGGLSVMHTMFLREHNRIAAILESNNENWTKEQVFLEARKIVGALVQHILFTEYLHVLFGGKAQLKKLKLDQAEPGTFYKGYNKDTEGTTSNQFEAASNRQGHSMPSNSVQLVDKAWKVIKQQSLDTTFFKGIELYENGVDQIARGMMNKGASQIDKDFPFQLSGLLFRSGKIGDDLISINIQRGRDHGIPPYNEWRTFCKLPPAKDFEDLGKILKNAALAKKFEATYAHVKDIDLFMGGVSEPHVDGALVGETFRCLLAKEYENIRNSDRFWYENKGIQGFSIEQLAEIKKATLARIFCNNGDMITTIQPRVFKLADNGENKRVACSQIEDPDFSKFKGPVRNLNV